MVVLVVVCLVLEHSEHPYCFYVERSHVIASQEYEVFDELGLSEIDSPLL